MNNTTNYTNELQSALYALSAILENHPLTEDEFNQLEEAWQSVGTALSHADNNERSFNIRIDAQTTFFQGVPFKTETTALALHRAYHALTLNFRIPLAEIDGIAGYARTAARKLVDWAVL